MITDNVYRTTIHTDWNETNVYKSRHPLSYIIFDVQYVDQPGCQSVTVPTHTRAWIASDSQDNDGGGVITSVISAVSANNDEQSGRKVRWIRVPPPKTVAFECAVLVLSTFFPIHHFVFNGTHRSVAICIDIRAILTSRIEDLCQSNRGVLESCGKQLKSVKKKKASGRKPTYSIPHRAERKYSTVSFLRSGL